MGCHRRSLHWRPDPKASPVRRYVGSGRATRRFGCAGPGMLLPPSITRHPVCAARGYPRSEPVGHVVLGPGLRDPKIVRHAAAAPHPERRRPPPVTARLIWPWKTMSPSRSTCLPNASTCCPMRPERRPRRRRRQGLPERSTGSPHPASAWCRCRGRAAHCRQRLWESRGHEKARAGEPGGRRL